MIELTRKYRKQSMESLRSLKCDDECNKNIHERNQGMRDLAAKYNQYTQEVAELRTLPQLNDFQRTRLLRLEQTIKNICGTLQRAR